MQSSADGLYGAAARIRGCFNCHQEGHLAVECQQLWCYLCKMEWTSIRQPGFHRSFDCPLRMSVVPKRTASGAELQIVTPPWKQPKGSYSGRGQTSISGVVANRSHAGRGTAPWPPASGRGFPQQRSVYPPRGTGPPAAIANAAEVNAPVDIHEGDDVARADAWMAYALSVQRGSTESLPEDSDWDGT